MKKYKCKFCDYIPEQYEVLGFRYSVVQKDFFKHIFLCHDKAFQQICDLMQTMTERKRK